MSCRNSIAFPLPMVLVFCLFSFSIPQQTLSGQSVDDPFGLDPQSPFGDELTAVTPTKKQSADDDFFRDKIKHLEQVLRNLKSEHASALANNELLKKKVNSLKSSEAVAKELAEKAVEKRNEMHQVLFERLLNSPDAKQQELALEHLFACGDKYPFGKELPISIYTPELLRRISQLTESESPSVQRLAARSLFTHKPDMAIELGLQFGNVWRPLDHAKASNEQLKIDHALDERCALHYDRSPLIELLEEFQMKYGISIRIAKGVNQNLPASYKANDISVGNAFSAILEKYDLGFAIHNEEIVVMKKSDPKLRVTKTYNVRGLLADNAQLDNIINLIKQSFESGSVELTELSEHVFIAKATETDHMKIQSKLGSVAPPAKWYSK